MLRSAISRPRVRLLLLAAAALTAFAAPLLTRVTHAQDAPLAPPPAVDNFDPGDNLDALLAHLDANIASYIHSVPSFLCKERVSSEMQTQSSALGFRHTITESVFRVRRSVDAGDRVSFTESRAVKTIDGKPAPADADETTELAGPMSVFGIFSNSLAIVSSPAKSCFRYRLHPARKKHPADKIVITFENLPVKERTVPCIYGDKTSGRAFIDPQTLRVVRVEAKFREYEMQGIKETWDWAIDYAPVTLSGNTFWMPAKIKSQAVPDTTSSPGLINAPSSRRGATSSTMGTQQSSNVTYTLDARYTDYHLLNVTSRIIPVTGDEPAAPDTAAPGIQPPPP